MCRDNESETCQLHSGTKPIISEMPPVPQRQYKHRSIIASQQKYIPQRRFMVMQT